MDQYCSWPVRNSAARQEVSGFLPENWSLMLKRLGIADLTLKESKIVVMKKFNELQENPERWFTEFRNKIIEQKELLTEN